MKKQNKTFLFRSFSGSQLSDADVKGLEWSEKNAHSFHITLYQQDG